MEECNEEQEGVIARDLGKSRNRGGTWRPLRELPVYSVTCGA